MGFLAPWFLGGLAALGVPVFVHLLRKHVDHAAAGELADVLRARHAELDAPPPAALPAFVRAALRSGAAGRAGVCESRLCGAPPRMQTGALLLIVLDDSFSMRAGNAVRGRETAGACTAGRQSRTRRRRRSWRWAAQLDVLTQPIDDEAQLRAALESIQPGDGHANFGELGRAMRTLSETVRGPIDLHLFSDMQRSAMPANFADMVMPEQRDAGVASRGGGRSAAELDGGERGCAGRTCPIPKIRSGRAWRRWWRASARRRRARSVSLVVNGKVNVDEEGGRAGQRAGDG